MIVNWKRLSIILVFLLTFSLIAACGSSEQSSVSYLKPSPQLQPWIPRVPGRRTRSCLIMSGVHYKLNRTAKIPPTGFWGTCSPGDQEGKQEKTSWLSSPLATALHGSRTLTLARGAKLDEKILLAPGVLASGDLNWSPMEHGWLFWLTGQMKAYTQLWSARGMVLK